MTKVYNRFDYADEKRAALDLWAAKVAEIVMEKPKKAKKGNVGARTQVA